MMGSRKLSNTPTKQTVVKIRYPLLRVAAIWVNWQAIKARYRIDSE